MKRLFLMTMVFVATLGMAMASCSSDEPESPNRQETETPDEGDDESPEEPSTPSEHKTLIAYYSYTNNVERIVAELRSQIDADVVEIEPAEKGLDYAANNYALGTALLNAIRNNPGDASSYPAIDAVDVDMDEYDTVIIACPLWWSQMAAPFQTFLFHYGPHMAGKSTGVIVSSASSGISGVVADAKRLIPDGKFLEPNLWIRSSQTSNSRSMIEQWLKDIEY